ncbi:MAG TPA: DUF4402 domain-containing protein [Longimicrobiales bacterium]|nr:DUF4402 domain-containing protein [Longimicrobiales bacterium]
MRPRTMQAMWVALAVFVALITGPGAARGQVLVTAERDLDFGLLSPGAVTAVAATDLIGSAQLRIAGRGTFQVSFQLPASLTSPNGDEIPLVFGPADGMLTIRHKASSFDPSAVQSIRINPAEQEAQVNLGARAQPGPAQPAGSYSATIVMMVVQTGT